MSKEKKYLSILETYPEDWRYVSEGGATIVFSYTQISNSSFFGRVLRLRKATTEHQTGFIFQEDSDEPDDPGISFQRDVVEKLIEPQFLPCLELVLLDRNWLKRLALLRDSDRPLLRRSKDHIDVTRRKGILATDLIGHERIAIEIKPKWGFLPSPVHLSTYSRPVKTRTCRFCMHAYYKSKNESTFPYVYCPLDLFSGERNRILRALHNLWDDWNSARGSANNLRIFVKGEKVEPNPQSLTAISDELAALDPNEMHNLQEKFAFSICDIIMHTPVFRALSELQRTLDALDIEGLSKLWSRVHPDVHLGTGVSDPSPSDWTDFINIYPSPFKSWNHAGPTHSNLRHYITAYLLSAICKDCSVIIRPFGVQRDDRYHVSGAKGTNSVTLIDLDLKSIDRLSKWEKQDREIVECYASMDQRKVCIDAWAAT